MTRRGRPPKPTVLKLLAGNPGKRKLNAAEPKPKRSRKGERRCPTSLPAEGKALWKKLVPELDSLGLLTRIDDATLEGACLAYGRAKEAGKIVREQGAISVSDKGAFARHPAIRMEKDYWAMWVRFATEFGLTPAARVRLQVEKPPTPDDDTSEAFLFGGKSPARRP